MTSPFPIERKGAHRRCRLQTRQHQTQIIGLHDKRHAAIDHDRDPQSNDGKDEGLREHAA